MILSLVSIQHRNTSDFFILIAVQSIYFLGVASAKQFFPRIIAGMCIAFIYLMVSL